MTTHIYKQYDPQTRKLLTIRPSNVGGTTEDDSATILHFTYTQPDFLSTRTPYIIFNVKGANGEYLYYWPSSAPSFDGVSFAIPYAVVNAVRDNYLRYVLAFSTLGEELDRVEFEQSALDVLQIPHSLADALVIRPGIPTELPQNASLIEWVEYLKHYALFNPVEYDAANSIIRFSTYNGTVSEVNIGTSKPTFATLLIGTRGWTKNDDDGKYYLSKNVPGLFSEDKTVTLFWNEDTEYYAGLANVTLVDLNGSSVILRADTNPSEVWESSQIVKLDFLIQYTADATSVAQGSE